MKIYITECQIQEYAGKKITARDNVVSKAIEDVTGLQTWTRPENTKIGTCFKRHDEYRNTGTVAQWIAQHYQGLPVKPIELNIFSKEGRERRIISDIKDYQTLKPFEFVVTAADIEYGIRDSFHCPVTRGIRQICRPETQIRTRHTKITLTHFLDSRQTTIWTDQELLEWIEDFDEEVDVEPVLIRVYEHENDGRQTYRADIKETL